MIIDYETLDLEFDTLEWREQRDTLLLAWMDGNQQAADFLVHMFHIGEVWDDLIDKDKPVSDEQINEAFIMALFDLTGNPFFMMHASFLRPVMLMGINAWLDSVDYERSDSDHWRIWAFVLRGWYMELVAICAFLTGGYANMRGVGKQARAFFQTESYAQYSGGEVNAQ
jgi:hypothetical protein